MLNEDYVVNKDEDYVTNIRNKEKDEDYVTNKNEDYLTMLNEDYITNVKYEDYVTNKDELNTKITWINVRNFILRSSMVILLQ